MTRYLGCGENRESFQLHAVINEGELQQNLLAFNTEKVVTGTKQVLALQEVKTSLSQLPSVKAPRHVEDLLYEYPKVASVEERKQITSFKKQQDYFRNKAQDSKNLAFRLDGEVTPMDNKRKKQITSFKKQQDYFR